MRRLSLALLGVSALVLSACDELAPRQQQAKADCCCKDSCPTRPPAKAQAEADVQTGTKAKTETGKTTQVTSHARKAVRHGGGYSYRYRSETEGVGYLDEGDYSGGYRRVGASVSVEERETYSESARYSESGSGYSYSSGGAYSSGGGVVVHDGGGRGHGRRGGGGYAGVDRDGYLTWPGKTE